MRRRTGFLQGFPERLTETIEAQGITTRQLCECTGKERKTIYAYKYGDRSPDAVTLARMCCLLQVSADYLLFGTKKIMEALMKLYVRTTTDELELPVAVAGSAKELAEMTGTTAACVLSSISHGYKGWERVEVEDDDAEMYEMRRQDLR
jgi:transcriptional regulator with XRE-family HTH domain